MSLRSRLYAYVATLHGALVVALFETLVAWEERAVAVLLVVISFAIGVFAVRRAFVGMEVLRDGADFMAEREYTTRFRAVGHAEVDRLVGLYNSLVTELRSERTRAQEQQHFLAQVLTNSATGIVVLDFDGKVEYVNRSAGGLLGASESELVGRPWSSLASPLSADRPDADDEPRVVSLPDGRRVRVYRGRFADRGFDRAFYLLTELTDELRQVERAAYGKLIRMMAHEVGNSVGASSSVLESSLAHSPLLPERERKAFEDAVRVCIARLASLNTFMNDLADVVRLPAPRLGPCDIEEALSATARLLSPLAASKDVKVALETSNGGERVPSVRADRSQIELVLLNAAKNAIEASPRGSTVALSARAMDGRVQVAVENTGPGIPPDVRERLFTPFFSTKADGRGLGLTVAREVLQNHNAPFSLTSPPEGPTRFEFTLPTT